VRYSTGALLALFGRIGALLLGTLVAVALARWLGPAARGEFALVTLVPAVLVAVASLGLGPAELHLVSRDQRRYGAAVANALLFAAAASAVTAVIVLALAPALVRAIPVLREPALMTVVVLSVPPLLFYSFVHHLLQAMRAFAWSSALLVVGYLLFLAALAPLVGVLGLGLGGALVAWLGSHALLALVGLYALVRTGPLSRPDLGLLRVELRYGLPSWAAGVALIAATRAPLLVAGLVLAPAEVGRLAVAITLVEMLWYAADSAGVALAPLVARATGAGGAVPTPLVARTVLAITALGALVLGAVAHPLLVVLFGTGFADGAAPLRWLLPGVVALAVAKVLASDLFGRGRPGRALVGFGAGAGVSVALSLLLVPVLGTTGAALAASLSYAAAAACLLVLYVRETGTGIGALILPRRADARVVWLLVRGTSPGPLVGSGG